MSTSKVYEILQENILKKLDEGVVPWRKAWNGGEPRNIITNRAYSGFNVFWLACQGFTSKYWMTMRQVNQLKGTIKEEDRKKYTVIVYWKFLKREVGEGEDIEEKTFPMIRYYKVWNLDQTENITVKWETEEKEHNHDPIESCEQIIKDFKSMPKVVKGNPAYAEALDVIRMPELNKFDDKHEYYSAIFHEMGHCTKHFQRLNRQGLSYAREELVAELTACYLCGVTGISPQTIDNQASYIAGWKKRVKEDVRLMVKSASEAQKASDYVLNKVKVIEEAKEAQKSAKKSA